MRWSRRKREQRRIGQAQCRETLADMACAVTPESVAAAREIEVARINAAIRRQEKS